MALVNWLLSSYLWPARVRVLLYKAFGFQISARSQISAGVHFRTRNIVMGRKSTVNLNCVFDNRARVTIGEHVGVGIGVMFVTSSHDMSDPLVRAGQGSVAPISVGDGVWIGSGSQILCGVTIGPGAVIAAGSVVRSDCDAHTLYGGVPARPIRTL